jgi:hypothetical protein
MPRLIFRLASTRVPCDYSARQIAALEDERAAEREQRSVVLSRCEVNEFALDDHELATLVRERWYEAGAS